MLQIKIPGRKDMQISHVVFDYNGTIALDGRLLEDLASRFSKLKEYVQIYVITADTHGTARAECEVLKVQVVTFAVDGAAFFKEKFVRGLDGGVACIGNGFNDIQMFNAADLSIAVLGEEGCYPGLLNCADVLVKDIFNAIDLLLKKDRLRATLRT